MKTTHPLTLAISIGVLLLVSLACSREINPSGLPLEGTAQPVKKELTGFSQISGTNLLIAGINQGESGSGWDFSLRSGSGYSYEVYNYVFFDLQSEQFQTLLPSNENAIIDKIGLPLCCDNPANDPIKWWLYYVVKEDTNQDQRLSSGDKFTLSLSDVGGQGYLELIPGVDQALGQFSQSENVLFFFYLQDGQKYFAKIDLPGRRILSTTPLPSFGEDVK